MTKGSEVMKYAYKYVFGWPGPDTTIIVHKEGNLYRDLYFDHDLRLTYEEALSLYKPNTWSDPEMELVGAYYECRKGEGIHDKSDS